MICGLAALAVSGPGDVDGLAQRLRLSNSEASALRSAASFDPGLDPAQPEAAACAALYRLGSEAFRRAAVVAWARSNAAATDAAWRKRALLVDRWSPPKMPFSGSDVLALGIPAGPSVGEILRAFETWWIAAAFPADRALQLEKFKAFATNVVH